VHGVLFANCTEASMEDSYIISIPYCDIDNQATYYFSMETGALTEFIMDYL
jgi:hypothetical protein